MTRHQGLAEWVNHVAALCQPDQIRWCDGSPAEYQPMLRLMVQAGTAMRLDPERPNSIFVRSDPADVARVEDRTFICSASEGGRRPHQQLARPGRDEGDADRPVHRLDEGPHAVRDPLQHGPDRLADREDRRRDHRLALRRRQHAHHDARRHDGARGAGHGRRVRAGLHSVGAPLEPNAPDSPWPCNATNKYICHFPETREIWSFGSGYGGNALLGKKCHALRIASVQARDEGWLAEHMLILKLTNPAGEVRYVTRRVPLGVRQDQPGDADPDAAGLEGRDDRRRHRLDEVRPRRPALRDQPRGRLLRRGARHQHEEQPERHAHARRRTRSSPTARSRPTATSGGRR